MELKQLIGKQWEAGQSGPDTFDCWGLIRYIYNESLDIQLPFVPIWDYIDKSVSQYRSQWVQIKHDKRSDFDLIVFYSGFRLVHVGLSYQKDVIHCQKGYGVSIEQIFKMMFGYTFYETYRYR